MIWSKALPELQEFVEKTGIPFYTTPQGRGVVPDDHEYSYLTMRSTAFRDTDLLIVVGTRMNYIIGHAAPPRFNGSAKSRHRYRCRRNRHRATQGRHRHRWRLQGGTPPTHRCERQAHQCGSFLRMAANAVRWRDGEAPGAGRQQADGRDADLSAATVRRDQNFMQRDAILVVDGQEILNFGRQSMPTFTPGHRLNSGPFGTMGVGLPFGIGAKIAKPDKQVIVVHGDGSFGLNALELDSPIAQLCDPGGG